MVVRVDLVVGPTGSGKSERAEALAAECGAPIVVADRFQCLTDMPISTARPADPESPFRRVFLAERTLADGPLSGRDACAALFTVVGSLSVEHDAIVVEGGSISLAAALCEFSELPFDLTVWRRSIGSRLAHLDRLTARARTMVEPPAGPAHGMLGEVACAWRHPDRRPLVHTVNGPEAVLDWCTRNDRSPADLDEVDLTADEMDSLVVAVAEAHLFHALDQERAFAAMFPDATVEHCDHVTDPAAVDRHEPTAPTVAVICGARPGVAPEYMRAAVELGRALASSGYEICYGGASLGLMGAVADGALDADGTVVGVIPRHLMAFEIGHPGLTRQHVVPTMAERKTVMTAYSDICVALPGGLGTLDELFEFATMTQLGLSHTICVLVDVRGYWTSLSALIHHMHEQGFVSAVDVERLVVVPSVDAAVEVVDRTLGVRRRERMEVAG
ncbi:MAG: TIGR00730 family Rossman fold protein [Rhodococcus sp. (in: high G+C Gram-positive bacteria)]